MKTLEEAAAPLLENMEDFQIRHQGLTADVTRCPSLLLLVMAIADKPDTPLHAKLLLILTAGIAVGIDMEKGE